VVDDVLEHDHPPRSTHDVGHRGQGGAVHRRQGATVQVKAREALDGRVLPHIDGYAVCFRVGDHVTEIGEPALGHQVRPRPVPGGQGPSNDLLGLGDVEPALGLDPAPQSDIGQGDVVGEAGILRVGDLVWHRGSA